MNHSFFQKFQKIKILILFFLLGLFFFSIYHKQEIEEKVSTFFLNIFLKKVKNHLNDKIYIKHASINFLEKNLIFYDVKILDHHRFSFIHLSKCKISIDNLLYFIFINSDHLRIRNIFVENSSFFVKKYFREKENNVILFIKKFLIQKKLNKNNVNFITCSKLIINKFYLEYNNTNSNEKFKHFFSSCIKNIKIDNKKIKASIYYWKSKGLIKRNKFPIIENLSCDLIYHYPSKLKINNFLIKTSGSYLKGYFTLFQGKGNQILFPQINIRGKIIEGSKLGSDLGTFFSKKWNSPYQVFIQSYIHCQFYHKKKIFFLYDLFIRDSQKNKLFADQIHIFYAKKKWKEIKFFKTFMKFNPYDVKKIIPYNFDSKLIKFILNFQQHIIYKGDFTLSLFENKKSLKIKGIVKNRFFVAKISTYVDFLKNQYAGKIFIEKKYLFIKKKNSIFWLLSKIPFFVYHNTQSNLCVMNFEGNFYKFFITLLFSHSKYKMRFIGKIFSHFQKIYIDIYNQNKINKNIKIIFINNNNQSFQKIRINIYDMIIGYIYERIKCKNLFPISCFKNPCEKEIKYVNFNFLIKKSFFDFIQPVNKKNTFSDIQISGEKKDNALKMIFYTKKIQSNDILIDRLFVVMNFSFRKKMQIHIGKIIYKNFFSNKINISVLNLNQKNFWRINSELFFKFKKQEYKKQILNFFCKKEENFLVCFSFFYKLNINGYDWITDSNYHNFGIIKIDLINQKYIIDNIIFSSDKQKIIINANYVKKKQKIFQFYLKNVQLKKIIYNQNIDGLANGFFLYKNVDNQDQYNQFEANIVIQNFSIEKTILGNFYISSFHKNKNNYGLNGVIRKNSYDILKVFGNIKNIKDQSKLNLNIIIQNLRIDNFYSFWKKMNSEGRGTLTGKIQVFGYLNDLHYFGKLEIQKFGIKINSTNTNYEIKTPAYINIFSKSCTLSPSYFVDTKYNTKGCINGFFSHRNLIQWHLIKLSINTRNLLVVDSNKKQNHFFFGKIFTHGKIEITKKENKIRISMNNGKILNSSHLYINPQILEFQKKNISEKRLNDNNKKEGNNYLLLDINTIVNKNTKVSILLKKNHFIEFRGEGFLFIEKTYKKNVQTSGRYFVKDGLYHFYSNEKIPIKLEKKFKIKPGGSITWKNDFYQSNIDLIAYETKYVYNVIEYIDFIKKQHHENMIFTELRIHIFGKIEKPNIHMEILFPESNEEIQEKLSKKLNSFEEKIIQFGSILISGKFFLKNDTIKNFFYYYIYKIILKKLKLYNNIINYLINNHYIFLNFKNHCFIIFFLKKMTLQIKY